VLLKLSDIDYNLPPELIAQEPSNLRTQSRLMVLNRQSQTITHQHFFDLPGLLKPNDVLVLNNTKVIKARLSGHRQTGGEVECFLVEQVENGTWKVMLNPTKRLKVGECISIAPDFSFTIKQKYLDEFTHLVEFNCADDFFTALEKYGHPPLPPYIKQQKDQDLNLWAERYQTIYAEQQGAVAAPTAGLHFTKELLAQLQTMGVQIQYVTLHVGLGTFLPIKTLEIGQHKMHAERFCISTQTAKALNQAKAQNRRIIAVGTTVARTLESGFANGQYQAQNGSTEIFIYPDYQFKALDGLITNFHLPKSTLLLMIMALAGQDFTQRAYQEAINQKYRFFSFGDAMLIL
jgi:S-adenosylmethionine:tRNA ribosyltransferase-isomerase